MSGSSAKSPGTSVQARADDSDQDAFETIGLFAPLDVAAARLAPTRGYYAASTGTAAASAASTSQFASSATAASAPPTASGGPQMAVTPEAALPTDPLLSQQWHLGNPVAGLRDLNVRQVWNPTSGTGYTGAGTRVVVIDNGFDYAHVDLAPNYDIGLDFDFESNTNDAAPRAAGENHGTAVMGIIGAAANGIGAVGVAYGTSLVGYRTANLISDAWLQDIRDAIFYSGTNAAGDVASISQGISNDINSEFGVGYNAARFDEIEESIRVAVTQGRGGRGTTIVKAAGNSRAASFDVNADDWTNDTRQVVVAAVNQNGFVSSYSSYGAAILVSGFGTPGQVVTTDRSGSLGYNTNPGAAGDYTSTFNGTSAATPMVAGVAALMYDANASLGWRDVQQILAYSASKVGSAVGASPSGDERYSWEWNAARTWNGGGLHYSADYGYGLVNGLAAVRLSESWLRAGQAAQTSSNELSNTMDMLNTATVIPDGNATGLTFSGGAAFNDEVDRVTVTLAFSTTFTGDLRLFLTSPGGHVTTLIADNGGGNDFNGTWTFETQAYRGERAAGTWTVRIADDAAGDTLTVSDIVVRTYGRSSTDDRYVFTDEYGTFAGVGGHSQTLTDASGIDEINAAAVTTGSVINLQAGASSTIAGQALTIAAGTVIENAFGGDGNDTIVGNVSDNRLFGNRGSDVLFGGGGADQLWGDDGDDNLFGDAGADALHGGAGFDYARYDNATAGVTAVLFKPSVNTGEAAGDTYDSIEGLFGSAAFGDNLQGDDAGNTILGLGGDDLLFGLGGGDALLGGDGNDNLWGGLGTDYIDGGAGFDYVRFDYATTAVTARLDNAGGSTGEAAGDYYLAVEGLIGSAFADVLVGDGSGNTVLGLGGNDVIFGLAGNDALVGGDGDDSIWGDGGTDYIDGGAGFDYARYDFAGSGVAIDLSTGSGFVGEADGDYVTNIEGIVGSGFADYLVGSGENNFILGQGGNDIIFGGQGADNLFGGAGADTFAFRTADFQAGVYDNVADFSVAEGDVITLLGVDPSIIRFYDTPNGVQISGNTGNGGVVVAGTTLAGIGSSIYFA